MAPRAYAQDVTKPHAWHDGGNGGVEVDTSRVTVDEGGMVSYRIRLTKAPVLTAEEVTAGKKWYVRFHIDGHPRYDGEYDADGDGETDISWVP